MTYNGSSKLEKNPKDKNSNVEESIVINLENKNEVLRSILDKEFPIKPISLKESERENSRIF